MSTVKSARVWTGDTNVIYLSNPVSEVEVKPAIYELSFNPNRGLFLQKVRDKFELPKKVYNMDTDFIRRTIKSFQNTNRNMGVLLTGIKGAGKTITGKIIANELNLPVILITHAYGGIAEFINSIDFECVVFIDEYEKVFPHDERGTLLTCMDGVQTSAKKALYVLTTNSMYVNDNLLNRPSRVRYVRKYRDLEKCYITEIVNDLLINKDHAPDTIDVISKLDSITVDLIVELIREANLHEEPASKFISIFNCNQSTHEQFYSYKLTDKITGEVYYESTKLRGSLGPHATKNTWIYDSSHSYFCLVLAQTGENSCQVKLLNPAYTAWWKIDRDEDDEDSDDNTSNNTENETKVEAAKSVCPPEYIEVDVAYEQIARKHWMFSNGDD